MEFSKARTFNLGLNSPEASRLRETVSHKLSEFMGSYTDDVLAEYVVVLVCNGKHQIQARKDLEAFLGDESGAFVAWLWEHLATNMHLYNGPAQPLHFKGSVVIDEEGKSNFTRQAKMSSKEDVRRSSEEKTKRTVDSESLSKGVQVSFSACEEVNDRCFKGTQNIQRRDCIGFDNNLSGEKKGIARPQTNHYKGDKCDPDESDQCENLKHSSALKRQHSPEFWSGREQRLQYEKHAKKRINSSPHVAAPRRLLQSAVREAVTPSEMANSKRSESEVKRLRSVVVENADTAMYTVLVPHMANVYARSLPATAVAMQMDTTVAAESNANRVRSTGSVWDRLGKAFDEDSTGLQDEVDEYMMDVSARQKMENRLLKADSRGHDHGKWHGVEVGSGRDFSGRLSKGLTENKVIENEVIVPTIDSKGYGEAREDILARCIHACASSSRGNGQLEENETYGVSRPLIYKQEQNLPSKETDKSRGESLTVKCRLAQNFDKTMSESDKQNASSAGVVDDASQKIVNISVNVNTWKRANYQTMKDAVDGEVAASSAGLKLLQDPTEMPVGDSLPDKTDAAVPQEGAATHGPHQNDVTSVRSRLHQVELEMAKLRAKQAEVCKDVRKTASSTSGVETSLVHSEEDVDSRTVFVTNVHFAATREALSAHFSKCGEVVKVIMLTDSVTSQPKGSAYVSFASKEAAEKALALNGTSLLSRMLKVVQKTAAHLEASPIAVRPPLHRAYPFAARHPIRAAYARGFPYTYGKGCMPRPQNGSQHLQWRRDASDGGSNGKSDPSVASLKNPAAGISSASTVDGNLAVCGSTPFTHSFTYVRVPTESSKESPATA